MFDVLKRRMTLENYNAFINDYKLLYHNKQCGQYKQLYSFTKNANIFAKSIYDELHDKFNYIVYKQIAKNNAQVHALLQSLLKTKGIYAAFIVELHYLIEIYISFLIEYVLKQELNDNNIRIIANNHLDIVMKIDMMIDNKPIQIKNYSFISCNDALENRLTVYKKISGLSFIFYSLEEDNIYIKEVDNRVLLPMEEINGFSFSLPTKNISVDEAVNRIKSSVKLITNKN